MYKGGRARNCCTLCNNGKLYLKRANSLRFAGDRVLTLSPDKGHTKRETAAIVAVVQRVAR